jgi:exodeoxyribonuclease V
MGKFNAAFAEDEFTTDSKNKKLSGKPRARVTTLEMLQQAPQNEMEELAAIEKMMGAKFTENCLSDEQQNVFGTIVHWIGQQLEGVGETELLTLGGYAGTGKTTLLCALASFLEDKAVAFCSLTGKAVNVLRQKFVAQNTLSGNHEISTIHQLLYHPITDQHGRISGWSKKSRLNYDLIVIDEGSMVSERILQDFLHFGIPILAVGDHGQLPPVEGSFNLMADPGLTLEHIHRQAKGSPVLALSEEIRNEGRFPSMYQNTSEVQFLQKAQIREVLTSLYNTPGFKLDDLALLCFSNKTRNMLNDLAREIRWGKGMLTPRIGDQIICLKNTHDRLFNGMRGEVSRVGRMNDVHFDATIDFRAERIRFDGALCRQQFGRDRPFKDLVDFTALSGYKAYAWEQLGLLVDYGYALTVHKAQGSELPYVVLYDDYPWDRFPDPDFYKRWAYTGVSRCRKFLAVLR